VQRTKKERVGKSNTETQGLFMINEWRLARKGALWLVLAAFTRKPRRGTSSLAEAATKS
jgi:hypothetical protein